MFGGPGTGETFILAASSTQLVFACAAVVVDSP